MAESPKKNFFLVAIIFCATLFGILVGGYFFRNVQPRSFLAFDHCEGSRCLNPNEFTGLLASVGLTKLPSPPLLAAMETDKTIAFEYQRGWFVLFPKRDIKDASDFSPSDAEYLQDIYAVMGALVRERKMDDWQIFTNGRDLQHIRQLHFHLIDRSVPPFSKKDAEAFR